MKLRQQYEQWLDSLRDVGIPLSPYQCPDCETVLYTQRPDLGRIYDSATVCPYCGSVFFKMAACNGSVAVYTTSDDDEELGEVPALVRKQAE